MREGKIASGLLYALQDGRLGAVLERIHGQPERPWSVDQLAALANMSRSRFSACFSQVMGMSPMGYVSAWRMKVAQGLLRDGVPIKVTADAVGYSSQASFSRTFTSQIGLPPAEWLRSEGREETPVVTAHLCADDETMRSC